MLTTKQISEIREHLEKAQNPLFFFDNDTDGLASFLLLQRFIQRGKGVAIKSFPDLDPSYFRKVNELNPDYIFILDKPVVSERFFELAEKNNLPVVWIDHHDVKKPNIENYFNPYLNDKTNEPTSYLCQNIANQKQDAWISLIGCIGDCYMPDFFEQVKEQYPDLFHGKTETPFDVLYKTKFGEIIRMLNFALKDRTTNVIKMMKYMMNVQSPFDLFEENSKTESFNKRFKQIDEKYQRLIEKAKTFASDKKLLYFQYSGELSISGDISNELSYLYPDKIIVVAFIKGTQANISLRGKIDMKELTQNATKDIEGASGGGHLYATGAKLATEFLPQFKKNIEKALN